MLSVSEARRQRAVTMWQPCWRLTLSAFLLLCQTCSAVRQSHYVHWNTSNPIFRIDNTDHIIDVNRGNQPWEYDQVNIICPLYRRDQADEAERYIIYSVSKEEYESCRIMSTSPRVIAQCTQPHTLMYFTISFRSFTPTPGGLEFKPGRDYYFISTSSDADVNRRVGGKCSTHNMKVQFKVADNNHETPPRAVNVPRHRPVPPPSRTTTSTTTSSTTERSSPHQYSYGKLPRYYGDLSYYPDEDYDDDYNGVKRSGEYDVHPNDVIKHEASRMASGSVGSLKATKTVLLLVTVTALQMTLRHRWW